MEDKRAHERIDNLEQAVAENTALTKQIAENTTELVALVKGVKGFRAMIVWGAPVVAAIYAVWHWIKG